ncbi:NAD(P)-binding domain-containing protein [Arthrobacter sp. SLBN-122]|uniref:NAD(P)-binding domain-containing protein n=1 Tax=Arthrobacter sp. SLBN-122 TaxID=2768455 RepID=UPI00115265AF|nr:NAD(P)-binding domain-containing protein [Arthrobacter sp. SLBN-122]TQJ34177.1 pyrroline-5-carboxylate reductase [Arthrobacter sp. SLBN-122]
MTVFGIIGVGSIAAAIVTGLCEDVGEPPQVVLSPRSQARSSDLAARFRTVTIASTNQEVVDQSDVVVLCVLPHQAEEVLGELVFGENQGVVSAVAGVHLSVLQNLVFPAKDIARSIPAPAVATRSSITPIYPATEAARDLYDRLGGGMVLDDELAYESVSAASATVEAYFHYLGAIADWLVAHGVAATDARRYVAATFSDLSEEMDTPHVDFNTLARTHTTKEGLNEQFAKHLTSKGTFTAVGEGLDAVLARLSPN